MTTNANAPVETRHEKAANRFGFLSCSQLAHAQTLANLEAANNRLAEIEKINADHCWSVNALLIENSKLEALASGHTPSPCPSCAAKDEAITKAMDLGVTEEAWDVLKPYRIPPADPVAEALKAVLTKHGVSADWDGGTLLADLAELSSLPLGGAK